MGEVGRAVQGIDVPLVIAAGFDTRAFFAHHVVSGKLRADSSEDQSFGFAVGDGDQVGFAFVFDLHLLIEVAHQQGAGLASHRLHGLNQILGMV